MMYVHIYHYIQYYTINCNYINYIHISIMYLRFYDVFNIYIYIYSNISTSTKIICRKGHAAKLHGRTSNCLMISRRWPLASYPRCKSCTVGIFRVGRVPGNPGRFTRLGRCGLRSDGQIERLNQYACCSRFPRCNSKIGYARRPICILELETAKNTSKPNVANSYAPGL